MNKLNETEWKNLEFAARNIVDAIVADSIDAEIIIKYKNHINFFCNATTPDTMVPESFRTGVYTFAQHVHAKKGECKIASDVFSLFFKTIQGKSFEHTSECLINLNDLMAVQVQKILEKEGDSLKSWVILQLLLCVEGELPVVDNCYKLHFLKTIVSIEHLSDYFNKIACNELDTIFYSLSK